MPDELRVPNNDQSERAGTNSNHSEKSKSLLACGAGIVVMIVGTILWIIIAQKYKMPFMSIVIAFGISYAIQYVGKTTKPWYGFVAATLSFISAIIGNIASGIFIYCVKYPSIKPKAILSNLNIENAITLIEPVGWPIVLLCTVASVFIGFRFAFKQTKIIERY